MWFIALESVWFSHQAENHNIIIDLGYQESKWSIYVNIEGKEQERQDGGSRDTDRATSTRYFYSVPSLLRWHCQCHGHTFPIVGRSSYYLPTQVTILIFINIHCPQTLRVGRSRGRLDNF